LKYIVLLGDGMADYPLEVLDGKTPLEYAHTPNMDLIAKTGTLGRIDTIPSGFIPGSDVANLSVLGYDSQKYYTGRGPLEAANMGLKLNPADMAFRCNLVTLKENGAPAMQDFTSGHISSEEARHIITDLQNRLGSDEFQFFPGVGYRHLLVWRNCRYDAIQTTPPHDIIGRAITSYLPAGEGAQSLLNLMQRAKEILFQHAVNKDRLSSSKKPANAIWPWGQGRAPQLLKFTQKYELKGGMISAVDLLNGIGVCTGLEVIPVKGATGYTNTNYIGKARKALDSLNHLDFIFVHVEAPDEMGHEGNIDGKIQAIEDFDEKVVGTILNEVNAVGPFRLMVLCDHPTPIVLKSHAADPSPFAVLSFTEGENLRSGLNFEEKSAIKTNILVSPGHLLMDFFMGNWRAFIEGKSR
jgi:2,3-bisphosphoglycerate-independent phosphoglycerate mutase